MADGVAFRKGTEAEGMEVPPSQRAAALRPSHSQPPASEGDVERITVPDLNPPDGDRVSFSVADRWDRSSSAPLPAPRRLGGLLGRGIGVVMAVVAIGCMASIAFTFVRGGGLGDVVGRAVLAGLSLGVGVGILTSGWRRLGAIVRRSDRSRAIVLAGDALILERRFRGANVAEPEAVTEGPTSERGPRLPIWRMGLHERFGLTLLSSKQGQRLVALITTPTGTFPLATRLTPETEPLFAHLVRSTAEVSADDNALFAAGPDGQSVVLTPTEFNSFITRLLERDPTCLGRFMLSDQAGRPVLLDDGLLVAQGCQFDLRSPVEWRSIQFQEAFGSAVTYYQGTWVRQGVNEVVFVSLLPPSQLDATVSPDLATDATATPGAITDPPPVAQRVAMEGFFVAPMRSALRDAPRVVDAHTH